MNILQVVASVSEKLAWIESQFQKYLGKITGWIIEISEAPARYVNNTVQFINAKIQMLQNKIREGLRWLNEWINKQKEKLAAWLSGQIQKIKDRVKDKAKQTAERKALASNPVAATADIAKTEVTNTEEYAKSMEEAASASAKMAELASDLTGQMQNKMQNEDWVRSGMLGSTTLNEKEFDKRWDEKYKLIEVIPEGMSRAEARRRRNQ